MPKTPDYFHGKTIVITGAASGIGRATALIFAREGANVVCADIDEARRREDRGGDQQTGRAVAGAHHRRHQTRGGRRHGPARARRLRPRAFPVQLGRRCDQALEIPRYRRRPARAHARPQSQGHVLRHAGGAAAYAAEQIRRDRQCGEHGAPARRARHLGALRRRQRRGGDHDHGGGARIRRRKASARCRSRPGRSTPPLPRRPPPRRS